MVKHVLLAFSAFLICGIITAQTPSLCPDNHIPAADDCENACIYCNLEEYAGATTSYTIGIAPPFCGTLENNQWLAFYASDTTATITAIPSNCAYGNGIQVALYTQCGNDAAFIACDGGATGGGNTPVSITPHLIPGNIYYLMVDGYAGDLCNFVLNLSPPGAATGQVFTQNISLCPNETYTINGVEYSAPAFVKISVPDDEGCDSVFVYNLLENDTTEFTKIIALCPGESVALNGSDHFAPDTVTVTIPSDIGCDSVITYHLTLRPYNTLTKNVFFCPGESVKVAGKVFDQPGILVDTLAGVKGSCDTILTYHVQFNLNPADCPSCVETFMKIIGSPGQNVRGYGVYNAPDGNLYVTGSKQDSAMLIKVNPGGGIIWTRTFDIAPGANDHIADILTDSDGMIAGCGQSGDQQPGVTGFVFKYNPFNDNIVWVRTFGDESPYVMGILEKTPGGNYIVYSNPHEPANDAALSEVSRANGSFVLDLFSKKLDLGSADNFNSMLISNKRLYGVGRFTNGSSFSDMRHALARFDLVNGELTWLTLNHVPAGNPARLYGMDLLLDGDTIVSVSFGDETGENLGNSRIFLHKTKAQGNLLWSKRIDLQAIAGDAVSEIVRVADGYVLYCHNLGAASGDLFLIKTDLSGNLLWSKKVDYGGDEHFLQVDIPQSQMLEKGGYLYFTAITTDASGRSRMLLCKTTADAALDGDCDFITPTPATIEPVLNPANIPVFITESLAIGASGVVSVATIGSSPAAENVCKVFVHEQVEIGFCPGESVVIGGNMYQQPGTVLDTVAGNAGCDTIFTYTLRLLQQVTRAETVGFCPGQSVVIGGNVYTQAGTVVDTLPASAGCDTIVTYTLIVLPQPVRSETITFCPGESVLIGGKVYTQAGTVVDTLPAPSGCDTVVTYTLEYITTPNSAVSIQCPADVNIVTDAGTGPLAVSYNLPLASSDCECPGIALAPTAGLPSGGAFPPGTTKVCYAAKDSCGNTASCCFNVTVREVSACDVKTIGCLKWELLSITRDAQNRLTYRIRVTNNCANKLIYTAFQLPNGIIAKAPADNSVFTAESGRQYDVRNPNFTPFYSIRFQSKAGGIAGGQSDVLEYVLPGQAPPAYIHVTARLFAQEFYEAHLNTFYCPIGVTPANREGTAERHIPPNADFPGFKNPESLKIFPNPTSGMLYADLSAWRGESLQLQVFDSQGGRIQHLRMQAGDAPQLVPLPEGLAGGLYWLEVRRENGEKMTGKFTVAR